METRDSVVLHLHALEKQGRPGNLRGFFTVEKFEDPHLCPVAAIIEYNHRVSPVHLSIFSVHITFAGYTTKKR